MTDDPDPVFGGLMMAMYQDPELKARIQEAICDIVQDYVDRHSAGEIVNVEELSSRMAKEAQGRCFSEMNEHLTADVASIERGDEILLNPRSAEDAFLLSVEGFNDSRTELLVRVLEGPRDRWGTSLAVGNVLTGDQFSLHPSAEEVDEAF